MLAAHDQENRPFARSTGGSGKQALQPKTPGAKFPKTPMQKMPLNDQNGATQLAGGRSVLGLPMGGNENMRTMGKGKGAGVSTPLEPRTARAPLGNKTTNAKALATQQLRQQQTEKQSLVVKNRVREIEQAQQPPQQTERPSTARRTRVISPRGNAYKLPVLSDESAVGKLFVNGDDDIEYAPPAVAPRPYESDVFPDGGLSFVALRPENRLRGYYDHYYNPVGEDGVPLREKEFVEKQRRAFEKLDIQVQDDLDSLDWTISDVPASKDFMRRSHVSHAKGNEAGSASAASTARTSAATPTPPTIVSRKAAAALALAAKGPSALQPKMARPVNSRTAATASGGLASKLVPAARKPIASSFLPGLPLRRGLPPHSGLALRSKNGNPVAEAASRTTLGYNKGRSALSMVRGSSIPERSAPGGARAHAAGMATAAASATAAGGRAQAAGQVAVVKTVNRSSKSPKKSEPTAEPAEPAGLAGEGMDSKTPAFVSIFDVAEENADLGGSGTFVNDDDDDFQLDIKF